MCAHDGLPKGFVALRDRQSLPFTQIAEDADLAISTVVWREPLTWGDRESLRQEDGTAPRSLTHLLLRSPHATQGMLTIVPPKDDRLGSRDVQLLQIFASQLGTALENARLVSDLDRERNLLRAVLSNMTEAVFFVGDDGIVLLSNRAAATSLGVQEAEPVPPWLRVAMQEEPDPENGLLRVIERQGRIISMSVVDGAATAQVPASTIYVARDVTQEAQAERMKSDFVAYASHELRTPLTTIKMLTGLLLMVAEPQGKQREYLDVINTQVDRQTRLVNNLLDLARLEAGRYDLALEPMSLGDLLVSAIGPLRVLAEDRRLDLQVDCSQAPSQIVSNREGLEQVLTNLISNALKFTKPGGRVLVSCPASGEHVSITVEDTGVGMTPEQMSRIFTKFYTVRNPRKRGEGTGLGLAISDMIVKTLGGHIEVTSTLGVGSRFTVWLPLHPSSSLESVQPGPASVRSPQLQVAEAGA